MRSTPASFHAGFLAQSPRVWLRLSLMLCKDTLAEVRIIECVIKHKPDLVFPILIPVESCPGANGSYSGRFYKISAREELQAMSIDPQYREALFARMRTSSSVTVMVYTLEWVDSYLIQPLTRLAASASAQERTPLLSRPSASVRFNLRSPKANKCNLAALVALCIAAFFGIGFCSSWWSVTVTAADKTLYTCNMRRTHLDCDGSQLPALAGVSLPATTRLNNSMITCGAFFLGGSLCAAFALWWYRRNGERLCLIVTGQIALILLGSLALIIYAASLPNALKDDCRSLARSADSSSSSAHSASHCAGTYFSSFAGSKSMGNTKASWGPKGDGGGGYITAIIGVCLVGIATIIMLLDYCFEI
eukprot:c9151_g1_i1.p1 GENE.c9151_g1_i1~~c9151_g1_i1.p1  ORF type:complete len:362 (+),score=51.46 c9151_g1_i1:296-1381(+)